MLSSVRVWNKPWSCYCSEVVNYRSHGIGLQGAREKEQAQYLMVLNYPYAWLHRQNLPYSLCCSLAHHQIFPIRAWKQNQKKKKGKKKSQDLLTETSNRYFCFSEEKHVLVILLFFFTAWNSAKLKAIRPKSFYVPTNLSGTCDREELHGMKRLIYVMNF